MMTGKPETHGNAIEIRDLRVDYGDFVAVNDLSLTVPYGEVYGLVGPNGAGKTSTFRVLATLMEPTYGEVSLAGIDALEDKESARRIMGYMPDLAPVPSWVGPGHRRQGLLSRLWLFLTVLLVAVRSFSSDAQNLFQRAHNGRLKVPEGAS